MKRIILSTLFFCMIPLTVLAQQPKPANTLSEKQWNDVVSALEAENWNAAADYSLKYMKQLKVDNPEKSLARLRYVFLFASAGKVIEGKMRRAELEKIVNNFVGKEIVLPDIPIRVDCKGALNAICASDEGNYDLLIASTNMKGTSIHALVNVKLKAKVDYASHKGEEASVGGVIRSIELNPNVMRIWAIRITLEKGYIMLLVSRSTNARSNNSFNRTRN
jgi:hypothetical protein